MRVRERTLNRGVEDTMESAYAKLVLVMLLGIVMSGCGSSSHSENRLPTVAVVGAGAAGLAAHDAWRTRGFE